jgi:biopolymer transport protein ExbB
MPFAPHRLRFLFAALALLVGLACWPGHAAAWWNKDWAYRVKVVANAGPDGAAITEPIGRTQVLLRLHSGNFDFANVKDDGSDLRFVAADDKTPLHYHIERFVGQGDQQALVWVDIADLAPGATSSFYIYWGNPNAPDGSDAKATWDPDQMLVYHFGEENGLPKDATANGNNALTPGSRDEAGLIGYGLKLDRAPVRIAKSPSLAITAGQGATWTMWIAPGGPAANGVLFSNRDGDSGVTIGLDHGVAYAQIDTPQGTRRTSAGAPVPGNGWHHIAVVATDKAVTVYVDGQARGQVDGALPAIDGEAMLGGAQAPNAPRFAGLIDEFTIAKVARPLGALQVAVATAGPEPKLLSLDQPEAGSSGGPSYIVIIVHSVTPDAWVVIGLLGIMAALSWLVMVRKTGYLNRVSKANQRFEDEYRKVLKELRGDHVAALARIIGQDDTALRRSPLFRLGQIGCRELQERLDAGRVLPGQSLSPESLAAIRASMETRLVREQHRLNSMMVLLTVSISGGPFLGLLGTVVGVMITFAAIAAAGDVNVNAIAPGIAAALLATVAGLAVAIPAMFGYNYLLLRIKDVSADMMSFVNETVTRMGEARATEQPETEPEPAPPHAVTPSARPQPVTPKPVKSVRPVPRQVRK